MLNWLHRAFFGNFLLKVFALFLAIILHQYIRGNEARLSIVDVNMSYKLPGKDKALILVSSPVSKLKISIRGTESNLRRVDEKRLRYTFNLSNAIEGASSYRLYTELFSRIFPPGVEVIRITPSLLDVKFEKLIKRELPVKIVKKGQPQFGVSLENIAFSPKRVVVQGAESIVQSLQNVQTQPIDLSGHSESVVKNVPLVKPARNIVFLGTSKNKSRKIKVRLRFKEIFVQRTFKDVKIRVVNFLNPKLAYDLTPKTIELELRGPQAELAPLKPKAVIVEVDAQKFNQATPGNYRVRPTCRLPFKRIKTVGSLEKVLLQIKHAPTPPDKKGDLPKEKNLDKKGKKGHLRKRAPARKYRKRNRKRKKWRRRRRGKRRGVRRRRPKKRARTRTPLRRKTKKRKAALKLNPAKRKAAWARSKKRVLKRKGTKKPFKTKHAILKRKRLRLGKRIHRLKPIQPRLKKRKRVARTLKPLKRRAPVVRRKPVKRVKHKNPKKPKAEGGKLRGKEPPRAPQAQKTAPKKSKMTAKNKRSAEKKQVEQASKKKGVPVLAKLKGILHRLKAGQFRGTKTGIFRTKKPGFTPPAKKHRFSKRGLARLDFKKNPLLSKATKDKEKKKAKQRTKPLPKETKTAPRPKPSKAAKVAPKAAK